MNNKKDHVNNIGSKKQAIIAGKKQQVEKSFKIDQIAITDLLTRMTNLTNHLQIRNINYAYETLGGDQFQKTLILNLYKYGEDNLPEERKKEIKHICVGIETYDDWHKSLVQIFENRMNTLKSMTRKLVQGEFYSSLKETILKNKSVTLQEFAQRASFPISRFNSTTTKVPDLKTFSCIKMTWLNSGGYLMEIDPLLHAAYIAKMEEGY
ncbi:MAG: hypothetical protein ABIE74_13000 [Pseudomonadota bacterium]